MPNKKPGFSRRDLVWLMGFGFFVEAVALYMLLIDPAMTRLSKLGPELANAEAAQASLLDAIATARPQPAASGPLPPPLPLGPGETPSLVVQRALDAQVARSGARLLSTTLDQPPEGAQVQGATLARVRLSGSFEEIEAFVSSLATPAHFLTLDGLSVRAIDPRADRLQADLTLAYHIRSKEH